MKELLIECKNQEEKIAALSLLFGFGYKYEDSGNMEELFKNERDGDDVYNTTFPHILLQREGSEHSITMVTSNYHIYPDDGLKYKFTNISAIMKFLTKLRAPKEKVRISKDYEAVISKEYIQVGCQTIEWADFDKLVSAAKKIRK